MTGFTGRRIDRVLADGVIDALSSMDDQALRALRADAEQEETDLSFLRRMLQGRVDIVRAEQQRRAEGRSLGEITDDREYVRRLAEILTDGAQAPDQRPEWDRGRFQEVAPSRADAHRRRVEALVADVDMADVTARTDAELARALDAYAAEEREVSAQRRAVQQVMDAATAEIGRRVAGVS
jgi:hypothetical protein